MWEKGSKALTPPPNCGMVSHFLPVIFNESSPYQTKVKSKVIGISPTPPIHTTTPRIVRIKVPGRCYLWYDLIGAIINKNYAI